MDGSIRIVHESRVTINSNSSGGLLNVRPELIEGFGAAVRGRGRLGYAATASFNDLPQAIFRAYERSGKRHFSQIYPVESPATNLKRLDKESEGKQRRIEEVHRICVSIVESFHVISFQFSSRVAVGTRQRLLASRKSIQFSWDYTSIVVDLFVCGHLMEEVQLDPESSNSNIELLLNLACERSIQHTEWFEFNQLPKASGIALPGFLTALMFHEVCGHLIEHDDGRTAWLEPWLGKKLTDSSWNIDDIATVGLPSDAPMTAIGDDRRDIEVMRDGVLLNLIDARSEGPDTLPLSSQDVRHVPRARMSNLVVRSSSTETPPDSAIVCSSISHAHVDHITGLARIEFTRAELNEAPSTRIRPFRIDLNALDILKRLHPLQDLRRSSEREADCLGSSGLISTGLVGSGALLTPA